ncbi:lipopolysaccharide biosynthesis protein [Cupriavidus plantarum]|nr:lipopolysaccharide biosynthesis protein [Cupriavidus plantarum]REE91946.1 PST family polysaccharide transporter [Cupriavidus plantarum]SMR67308.1 polysaccharide transporter, PST family [Cupriavidus plantarum]
MRRRIAGNVGLMLLDRGAQVLVGLGIVAILARSLGTDGFAAYQYAQSVVFICASVALICGGEVVVPRLIAQPDPAAQHRLLAHVFRLRWWGACIGYVLVGVFLLASSHAGPSWAPALILGFAILLREPSGVVIAWMQAHTRNWPGVSVNLASLMLKAVAVAALAWAGVHAPSAYAGAVLAEALLTAALLALYYRRRMPHRCAAYDGALTRQLFHDGALFWMSFMLMMAARRVDQLLLRPHVPTAEFAAYAATIQIVENFTAVATILAGGIAPLYVYARGDARIAIRHVLRLTVFMTALGVVGASALIAMAPWIVHWLYGAAFADATSLLQLVLMVSPLVFADVGLTVLAAHLRRPRWIAIKWGIACVATIAVDWFAIPRFGAHGAILGYAVASAITVLTGLCLWVVAWRSAR